MVFSELIRSSSCPFTLQGQTSSQIQEFRIETPSSASSSTRAVSQYSEGVRPPPRTMSWQELSQSYSQVSEPEVVSNLFADMLPTVTRPAVLTLRFTSPCSTCSMVISGRLTFWKRYGLRGCLTKVICQRNFFLGFFTLAAIFC